MFNFKTGTKPEQTDKIEYIETKNNLINHVKSATAYRPKKFAIFGTKIADSCLGSNEFLNYESTENIEKIIEEQSPNATEILGRILKNNLNTYNHLINQNYKSKIKDHDDLIKNNRLNFLLGMRNNEKVFSIRPASLNELNDRLGRIYSGKISSNNNNTNSSNQRINSSTQTKVIYDLSKKQNILSRNTQTKNTSSDINVNNLTSESVDSFKKLSGYDVLKKLMLVDFDEKEDN